MIAEGTEAYIELLINKQTKKKQAHFFELNIPKQAPWLHILVKKQFSVLFFFVILTSYLQKKVKNTFEPMKRSGFCDMVTSM
jgi:hypothetical protein